MGNHRENFGKTVIHNRYPACHIFFTFGLSLPKVPLRILALDAGQLENATQ